MNKFEKFSKEEGEEKKKPEEEKETEREGEEIPIKEKEETEEEKEKSPEQKKRERYELFIDFGIFEKDLEKLEGFDELSEGRQALILKNLRQLTLGRIQEQAKEEYEKGKSEANFLGKVWRGITKEYQIAKQEKITKEGFMILGAGMDVHGDVLKDLIKRAADGPEVELKYNELEMKYVPESEDLNPEQKETVKEFNKIASDFSKIPEEWRFETASLKNRKKYLEVKDKYDLAKEELLKLKTEEKNLPDAISYVNKINGMIHENQFLNTHPDAERELERMSTSRAIRRVIATTAVERGGYMAAGYVARTATIGIMGLVGAPAAAAFLGGWRARQRTKESLKEQDIMARKGKEAKGETAKDVVKAESLTEKMTDFMNRIENINHKADKLTKKEIKEREKLFGMLKRRVNYTREKVQEGLVNFGGEKERLGNHYHLLETTARAGVCSAGEIREDIENRLEKFLQHRGEKTEKARKKKLVKSMVRGALMSAGFAAVGVFARHAQEFFAEGTDEAAKALESSIGEIPVEKPIENFPEIIVADTSEAEIIPTDTLEAETIPADTLEAETIPADTLETETIPADTLKAETIPADTLEAETVTGETETIEATEEPETYLTKEQEATIVEAWQGTTEGSVLAGHAEYQGGTSVWNEIENQLDERSVFQKMIPDFDKLGEAEHTHLVDYLKDKVVENPEVYGLPKGTDVDVLTREQLEKLDWDKLFNESATPEEITKAVPGLSDIQKANIIENNKILNELVQKTGKPIDSQTVDQTLTNVKEAGGVDEYLKAEAVEATEEPETYLNEEQRATIVKAQQEATKVTETADNIGEATEEPETYLSEEQEATIVEAQQEATKATETIEATEEPETHFTEEQKAAIIGARQQIIEKPGKSLSLNALNEQLDKGWFIFGGASSKQLESATEEAAQAFGLNENQADLFTSYLSQGEEMSKKALRGLIKNGEINVKNFSDQIEKFVGRLHFHELPQSSDWVPRTLGTGENAEIGLVRRVNENVYEYMRQADGKVQQLGADNLKLRINPEQPEVPTGTPEQASEKFGDETIRRGN